jgi:O-antigen/teichoic acid export membrane protein
MKKNQLKIGAFLSYVVLSLNLIIGILYTPILTKFLGQSEYGIYSLVASIVSAITVLDLGLGNAIIVFTARFRASGKKEEEKKLHGMLFLINIFLGIIAGIVSLFLYFNVDNLFGNTMNSSEINQAKILILMLTFNLIITFPFSIFGNIVAAYENFIFGKIVKIIQILLVPVVSIPMLVLGYKSIALVVIITLVNMMCLGINFWYCFKHLKIIIGFQKFDFKLLKEIFTYSFYIFLNQIIDRINWGAGQFVLGAISGAVSVAVYTIAGQLNFAYFSFSTSISSVLLPKITMMQEKKANNIEFTELFVKTGRIQLIIMGLVLTGFVLFGKYFINLWVGPKYGAVYLIACVLMIPFTIPLIQNVGLSILQAKNKYKFNTILYLFMAIFNIVASIPLAKLYGGLGAAIPTAVALIIGNGIIMNIYYHKTIGIDILKFWKNILKISICIMLAFIFGIIINYFLVNSSFLLYLIKIALYTGVYCLIIGIFSLNEYEKGIFSKPFFVVINGFKRIVKK